MQPKILLLDIETAPDVTWSWGVYQTNAIAVKEDWYILSYAAKWLDGNKITVRALDDYGNYRGGNSTESSLLTDMWKLLDEADIVVAHNGASFDLKRVNARLIYHNFRPYSPVKVVDTKRDLKKVACFSSNRLNWLCKQFKIGQKTMEHQDFAMWQGCMDGERKAWKKMKEYNKHDVVLLEELYYKISPWIPQPDFRNGSDRCPKPDCGSRNLTKKGQVLAFTRIYQGLMCNQCGARFRSKEVV